HMAPPAATPPRATSVVDAIVEPPRRPRLLLPHLPPEDTPTTVFQRPSPQPPQRGRGASDVRSQVARPAGLSWAATASVVFLSGLLGAALTLSMMHRPAARMSVTVRDEHGADSLRSAIFVDGTRRCDLSPCTFDIASGPHRITALTEGAGAQEQSTVVRAG